MGPVIICGDFNARCGNGVGEGGDVPPHMIVDSEKNHLGEALNDFLRSTGHLM